MTANELITALRALPPESEVLVTVFNFELGNVLVPVTAINFSTAGRLSTYDVIDSFGSDTTSAVRWYTSGGSMKVVHIGA